MRDMSDYYDKAARHFTHTNGLYHRINAGEVENTFSTADSAKTSIKVNKCCKQVLHLKA